MLLGRLRSGGLQFEARMGREFLRPFLNQKLGMVVYVCHPKLHGRLRSGGSQF
jgi:hypothetical protein